METNEVSRDAQAVLDEILSDLPEMVQIPGTTKTVAVSGLKPYTLECLTKLWLERDASQPKTDAETLKSMCIDPYFSIKEACLFVLNGYWRIKLFFGIKWRIWAYWRGYTESQMMPIIQAGKKKIPLTEHWTNMAYSVDMRTDWKKMTMKEAEQYRAELLSVANALSSRSSRSTDEDGGASAVGDTVVS